MKSRLVWLASLAIVSRLITSWLLQTPPEMLRHFGGFLDLVKNYNAAFSIQWPVWIFWPLVIAVIGYIIWQAFGLWQKKDSDFFLWGLIAIGAANNLIDRLQYGAVVDYIRLGWWPVFNLSDSMIVTGAIFLAWKEIKDKNKVSEKKVMCTMYLVRHGQTEWNAGTKLQGVTDIPLNARGIEQAEEVAQTFKDVKFSAIYTSDLIRAQRTAEIIKLDRELQVRTSEFLRERKFGSFEGMDKEEFKLFVDSHLDKIQLLNEHERWGYKMAPSIESDAELMSRFITYLREIALAHLGEKVLIVSHSGTLRTLLVKVGYVTEKQAPHGSLANGGWIQLESDGITFEVKKVVGLIQPKGQV